MEIDKIINRWFQQTFEKIQKELGSSTEKDRLIVGVLLAARKYTQAVLTLLAQKHVLPAKALLRILCELFVKVLWCLNVQGNEEDVKKRIHENFQSWDYSRLIQDKKLLENLEKAIEGDFRGKVQDALKKVDDDVADYKERQVNCILSTADIFRELSIDKSDWKAIYPEVYQNYSRAVHLDRSTFSRLVRYEGDRIACYDDWDDDINDVYANCLCMACDMNMLIRKYYGCPADELRQECLNLTSKYD
jgi:hypothetical protein